MKKQTFSRYTYCFLSLLLLTPSALAEQIERNVVVHHKVQESSQKLFSNLEDQSKIAHRYRLTKYLKLPAGAGTFDGKPPCLESKVRRTPVFFDSIELRDFDLKVYDYKDKAQVKKAKQSKTPTVPYIEGDRFNPKGRAINLQQDFSRFFEIECLPTRVHFVTVGAKRYEEYREGEKAWE